MGFTNFLTAYKLHLIKHVRGVFTFQDTTGLTEAEIKAFVQRLTHESAIPIPTETFEWLSGYFQYVRDKDRLLVYDNTLGLWHYEEGDTSLCNILYDYFTVIAEEANNAKDQTLYRYAKHFFGVGAIPNLAKRIRHAIIFMIRQGSELVKQTENYRYFNTVTKTRALLDMTKPVFNLKTVTFQETQPLHLTHISPVPINTTDDLPTLWLSLIDEYMMHDPAKIEYFYKVLAYMMAPYNYNQAWIYFIGDGRNGKGTIVKVLQDILGPHAIRMNADLLNAQPPASFKKDDALAASEGRSLLIFNEIDERMIASTQNIKDLTEGGRDEFGNKLMTVVRPAYSPNYEINICGIPLVVANSFINFSDWSTITPIFKRLILVPFDYVIKVEDPTILNKLALEYPKIQAWLYLNYFKYKGIAIKAEPKPLSTEAAFNQYREDSDIIGMFWKECVDVTARPTDDMLRSDLYRMYDQYCKVNGRKAIKNKGTNGFQNLIKPKLEQLTVTMKNGSEYIRGIRKSTYFDKEINNL